MHPYSIYIGKNVDDALSKATTLEKKVSKIEVNQDNFRKENEVLKQDLKEIAEKQAIIEIEMRKSNVVLSGITEDKGEICKDKVKSCLTAVPGIEITTIKKCYRLGAFIPGKHRDILIQFDSESEKYLLFNNKDKLPKYINIRDDIPTEIYNKRKELMQIFKLAKSLEKYKKTRFHGTKLRVGRTLYSKDNMHQLPPEISPAASCARESQDSLVSFGKHNPLSNHHECDITIEGSKYSSSEHYLQ